MVWSSPHVLAVGDTPDQVGDRMAGGRGGVDPNPVEHGAPHLGGVVDGRGGWAWSMDVVDGRDRQT